MFCRVSIFPPRRIHLGRTIECREYLALDTGRIHLSISAPYQGPTIPHINSRTTTSLKEQFGHLSFPWCTTHTNFARHWRIWYMIIVGTSLYSPVASKCVDRKGQAACHVAPLTQASVKVARKVAWVLERSARPLNNLVISLRADRT